MCTRSALAIAMLLSFSVQAAEVSFYAPYDGSLNAAQSAGAGFGVCKTCTFVDGKVGKALAIGPRDAAICYLEPGNLDKARGSIELWLQPQWPSGDRTWRALVWEEAPNKPGQNAMWLWKYETSIRFDVRDPGDHLLTSGVAHWKPGEWHHVVATWDNETGTRLYIDGKLVASKDFTWKVHPYARFFVGNRDRGDRPAHAILDELCIYTHPLSAEQVAAAYAGQLERTAAQSVAKPKPKPQAKRPKLIFHLTFDADCTAALAGGDAKPREAKAVTFVPGIKGRAARFAKGSRLCFAEAGNLQKERGAITLWYRPDWSQDQAYGENHREIWRCLFCEGPRPKKRHGSNMTWLWFWASRLRFDVSDYRDRYGLCPIGEWPAGQWHHIAVTWDSNRGRHLYLDGERVRGGGDSRKGFLPTKWETKTFPEFYIGSDGSRAVCEGAIDELRIFDAPLSDEQVRADLGALFPVAPNATHLYFVAGQPTRLRWKLQCVSPSPARGKLAWRLDAPNRERVLGEDASPAALAPGKPKEFNAPFTPPVAGEYRLVCRWEPDGDGIPYERRLNFWAIEPEQPGPVGGKLDLKLIETIDCAAKLPQDKLVSSKPTHVVQSPLGAYREADPARNARFALRVRMPNVGRPYVVDWDYPDDKPRTMEMIAQTVDGGSGQYELQTGAFCGAEYPLSNRMMTQRSIFWPRGEDIALIFMTVEQGRPVAAAKVRIYEVQGRLPKLPVREAKPVDGWQRMVGLYYEDPAFCYDFGGNDAMPGFKLTIDRVMDYMDYFGQNVFMYPGVWYQGPLYPSASQGVAMSRPHPTNFIEYMLLRFGQRGMSFIPTINCHSLPSLNEAAQWDESQLATGEAASGPLMMYWDGAPNLSGWHGTPPNYNPLHPKVREAILTIIDEMLDLYAEYPAFKGICFHLTKHCILSFGSLDAGYNDCCVEQFEADTGIRVPVDPKSPGRVNERYRWLIANAREQWIAWRCRALHDFYERIAARLRSRRPDLKLVLNCYMPSMPDDAAEFEQYAAAADFVGAVNRAAGIDMALYKDSPNIVVQRTIFPADYRWTRSRRRFKADPIHLRKLNLEARYFKSLRLPREAWINMHDRYFENPVGRKHDWKSFWGREMGWRVSTLNPNQDHCLETYVGPLANVDSMAFTKGGFLVGTIGIEQQVGRFTQAFRALPAKRFEELPNSPAPVTVRYLRDAAGLYVYLVNPTPQAASVELLLGGRIESITDLAAGKTDRIAAGVRKFALPPYGLLAYLVKGANPSVSLPGK